MSKVLSVQELNSRIKTIVEDDPLFQSFTVRGQVSNLKQQANGHIYFSLKDEKATINVCLFANARRSGLKTELRNGQLVIVQGHLNFYSPGGSLSVVAVAVEDDGIGDLHKKFLALKQKLEEKGMFAEIYKKPIPAYARRIGIVTSPTGAAIEDIQRVKRERNPYVELILSPAQVQGEQAPASIVRAIQRIDALGLDVLIVGRGGGSEEDLWCFNDESVADAIFQAKTPVISAVGHEIDFTIADFVADCRAATPSQAAELAIFRYDDFCRSLDEHFRRLTDQMHNRLNRSRILLQKEEKHLSVYHPLTRLTERKKRFSEASWALKANMEKSFQQAKTSVRIFAERLEGKNPLKKLIGGYGYIAKNHTPVRSVSDVEPDDEFTIRLHDGTLYSRITRKEEDTP